MTTIKTPEQIARQALNRHAAIDAQHLTGQNALTIATVAIRADRAQRAKLINCDNEGMDNALAVEVYDCLKDRETAAAERAAEWVAENENGAFWDRFVGPMLDEIEEIA